MDKDNASADGEANAADPPSAATDEGERVKSKEEKTDSAGEMASESEAVTEEEKSGEVKDDEDEADEDESGSESAEQEEKAEEANKVYGRGRRERKSVEVYKPEKAKEKERVIPDGKGEKLEDMPRVVANFKGVTRSDPHLKMLYSLIFGTGKMKEFKSHLLQFNGVMYSKGREEIDQEKIKLKMYKLTLSELKAVMDLVDVERSAESFGDKKKVPDKEALCNRLLGWLEEPKSSGKELAKSPGKRKSAGSAGSSASKRSRKATPSKKKATPAKKKRDGSAKKTKPAKKAASAKKSPPSKGTASPKKSPAKGTASPKKSPAKGTASPKKSPAKKRSPAQAAEEVASENGDSGVDFHIPGADIDKVRTKVRAIVEGADRESLTVKAIRKMLEDWLDMDLTEYKDAIRSMVMEVM